MVKTQLACTCVGDGTEMVPGSAVPPEVSWETTLPEMSVVNRCTVPGPFTESTTRSTGLPVLMVSHPGHNRS